MEVLGIVLDMAMELADRDMAAETADGQAKLADSLLKKAIDELESRLRSFSCPSNCEKSAEFQTLAPQSKIGAIVEITATVSYKIFCSGKTDGAKPQTRITVDIFGAKYCQNK